MNEDFKDLLKALSAAEAEARAETKPQENKETLTPEEMTERFSEVAFPFRGSQPGANDFWFNYSFGKIQMCEIIHLQTGDMFKIEKDALQWDSTGNRLIGPPAVMEWMKKKAGK